MTTGRMSPSAACWIRFEGNRWRAISQPVLALATTTAEWAVMSMGRLAPGFSQLATARPMNKARVVTTSK